MDFLAGLLTESGARGAGWVGDVRVDTGASLSPQEPSRLEASPRLASTSAGSQPGGPFRAGALTYLAAARSIPGRRPLRAGGRAGAAGREPGGADPHPEPLRTPLRRAGRDRGMDVGLRRAGRSLPGARSCPLSLWRAPGAAAAVGDREAPPGPAGPGRAGLSLGSTRARVGSGDSGSGGADRARGRARGAGRHRAVRSAARRGGAGDLRLGARGPTSWAPAPARCPPASPRCPVPQLPRASLPGSPRACPGRGRCARDSPSRWCRKCAGDVSVRACVCAFVCMCVRVCARAWARVRACWWGKRESFAGWGSNSGEKSAAEPQVREPEGISLSGRDPLSAPNPPRPCGGRMRLGWGRGDPRTCTRAPRRVFGGRDLGWGGIPLGTLPRLHPRPSICLSFRGPSVSALNFAPSLGRRGAPALLWGAVPGGQKERPQNGAGNGEPELVASLGSRSQRLRLHPGPLRAGLERGEKGREKKGRPGDPPPPRSALVSS